MELNGQDCGDCREMISFLCRRSSKNRHGCVWRLSPEGQVEFWVLIGAFGRNLWPFSFSGSGRCSSSSALPWKGIYREETVGTWTTLIRSKSVKKNHTAHKESGAGIQVSGFYCNSTVIFRFFRVYFFPHTNVYKYANRSNYVTMQRST